MANVRAFIYFLPVTMAHLIDQVVRDTSSSRRELTESVLSASYIFPEELGAAHNVIFELATYARSLEQQLTAARRSPGSSLTSPKAVSGK